MSPLGSNFPRACLFFHFQVAGYMMLASHLTERKFAGSDITPASLLPTQATTASKC